MSGKANTISKTVFYSAIGCVVSIPLGSFGGDKIYSASKGIPLSVLGWWQQSGLYELAGGVIAAVIISLIAWRMQKLGM